MVKKFTLYLLPCVILFMSYAVKSQDFHLSQYEASPQYFNPALTGLFDGDYRITLNFRNQWSKIASKPFRTSGFSFDRSYEHINGGFYILNNRAGGGNFNVLTMVASLGYDFSLKSAPHHHLVAGVQLGMIHKSVDVGGLLFNAQYQNTNGGAFNPNISNNENLGTTSIFLPEINVGGVYYFSGDRNLFDPFIGLSAFHITEPKETFFGNENVLPARYLIHVGLKYNMSKYFQISTYLMHMRQVNGEEFTATLMSHYYLKKSDTYLMLGGTYREEDAMLIHFGLKYHLFTYRVTYDMNVSSLAAITQGQGGFEMSIVYVMRSINPNPLRTCTRF